MESYQNVHFGCKHYHDCESCPWDDCVDGMMRQAWASVKEKAQAMLRKGKNPKEVSVALKISERSVYRYQRTMGAGA
jgi:hypothetical protein